MFHRYFHPLTVKKKKTATKEDEKHVLMHDY